MASFEDMARAARENHDEKIAEKDRVLQEIADRERIRLMAAEISLQKEVLPTLQEAKEAFAKQNIICGIEENESFSSGSGKKIRIISFRCCSKGKPGTSQEKISTCGDRVRFEHDGENLTIRADSGARYPGRITSIEDAVKFCLDSLFSELRI